LVYLISLSLSINDTSSLSLSINDISMTLWYFYLFGWNLNMFPFCLWNLWLNNSSFECLWDLFFVHLLFRMFKIIYDWNIIGITPTLKKIPTNFLFYILTIKIVVFFLLFFFFILIFILNYTYVNKYLTCFNLYELN